MSTPDVHREVSLLEADGVAKAFGVTLAGQRRYHARQVYRSLVAGVPVRTEGVGADDGRFWALRDVNVSVGRGESVAILGRNGAGKSTLLRLLSGHVRPDRGTVTARGRVAELFDLTAGFDPARSGRQNVDQVGVLRGLDLKTVRERTEAILAFSELGDRLDAPFGIYSQGMKLRLGFSIAVHTEPDILLIDEVLGVGDLQFKNKCLGHLERLRERTATVLVTHSLGEAAAFCDRALILDGGEVAFDGPAGDATRRFQEMQSQRVSTASVGPTLANEAAVAHASARWTADAFPVGAPLSLALSFRTAPGRRPGRLSASVLVYGADGRRMTDLSDVTGTALAGMKAGEAREVEVVTDPSPLAAGRYPCVLAVRDGTELVYRAPIGDLVVEAVGGAAWGVVRLPSRWKAAGPAAPPRAGAA